MLSNPWIIAAIIAVSAIAVVFVASIASDAQRGIRQNWKD